MTRELQPPLAISGPEAFQAAFDVSRETIARLSTYAELIATWQRTINLVAPGTLGEIWQRHFADSAQVLGYAPPEAKSWLDLGSGAGFPGLVIAIMVSGPEWPTPPESIRLIESDRRKAAFLREVVRQLDLPVDILCERIEKIAIQSKFDSDVITARALAPLDRLLALVSPFFTVKSKALLLKGRNVRSELLAAEKNWRFTSDLVASRTDPEARIVIISDLQAKSEG